MKFRTALLLGPLVLITAMAAAIATAVYVVIHRAAQQEVVEDLHRSLDVFSEFQSYRRALLRAQARVLADEPRLKALLATAEISPETVRGVASDLSMALEADLFLLIDDAGVVVVDIQDAYASGHDLGGNILVAEALRQGDAWGTWVEDQRVYQVHARRVSFADEILGVVLLGYLLDSDIARAVYRLTSSSLVIEHGERAIALSPLDGGAVRSVGSMIETLRQVPTDRRQPTVVEIDEAHYLGLAAALPGHSRQGDVTLRYVILRSLDRALDPGRKLQRILLVSVAVSLPAAFLSAIWLSRRLSRPIDRLVAFTDAIASGDLDARAETGGTLELSSLAHAMNHMARRMSASQQELAAKERIEQEMEIAAQIQASILPRRLAVPGLDVAARMIPATEVGGDYFDILSRERCWIAIGDVAGHGVPAGLVMMMVQNVLAGVVQARPDALPSQVCCEVNHVLVENVRHRLQRDEHVTLTLLRYDHDGKVLFAGAHEDIVIWRLGTRRCEIVPTQGTWLGVIPDIEPFTEDQELTLDPGDIMVLYTDGVTEAMDEDGRQFGMERLCAAIEHAAGAGAEALCKNILKEVKAWSAMQRDDISVVIVRRR